MAHRDTDRTDMDDKDTDHTDTIEEKKIALREAVLGFRKTFIGGGVLAFDTILSLFFIFYFGKNVYKNVKITQECRNIWNELLLSTGAEKKTD